MTYINLLVMKINTIMIYAPKANVNPHQIKNNPVKDLTHFMLLKKSGCQVKKSKLNRVVK